MSFAVVVGIFTYIFTVTISERFYNSPAQHPQRADAVHECDKDTVLTVGSEWA